MRSLFGRAAATLTVLLVVGCSGPSGDGSSGADGGESAGAVADEAGDAVAPDADRQVITNASASVVVDDPADGARRVSELVEAAGGRVDERTEYAETGDDGEDGASAD